MTAVEVEKWGRLYNEAAARAAVLQATVDAAMALHQPTELRQKPGTVVCRHCVKYWPCPTARALTLVAVTPSE